MFTDNRSAKLLCNLLELQEKAGLADIFIDTG